MSAEQIRIRAELRSLGRRRKRHEVGGDALAADIRRALGRIEGHLTRTEAASLLGVHRTTLYRVYGSTP